MADDHGLYRAGLRTLIDDEGSGMRIVAEAANGAEAVEKAIKLHPDVILMDVQMPGVNGIEATRQIRNEAPQAAVVIMSGVADDFQVVEAIRAGASGFIEKDASIDALLDAVRRAGAGETYLSPRGARRMMQTLADQPVESPISRPRTSALTEREILVLRLLAEGRHNAQVGALLGVSARTVGNHVTNIYAKLNVHNRASAMRWAINQGLV